ncbi:MAG TPA: hypothetical protein PKE50_10090, partial [Rhodocyclaceae bacterium]|nr:hypothetical protein [Rhodocyclaceae bacterium]
ERYFQEREFFTDLDFADKSEYLAGSVMLFWLGVLGIGLLHSLKESFPGCQVQGVASFNPANSDQGLGFELGGQTAAAIRAYQPSGGHWFSLCDENLDYSANYAKGIPTLQAFPDCRQYLLKPFPVIVVQPR